MKTRYAYALILVILSWGFLYSCVKKPSYPSIPLIAYKTCLRFGANPLNPDSIKVAINFQDEEGDVGMDVSEAPAFLKNGNLFMTYFYDSANGHFAAWDSSNNPLPPFDTLKIDYLVPRVLPANETSQPMKGVIYVKLNKLSIRPFSSHKTIKYKICLYDKAMHKSNTIESDPLVFQ